MPTIDRKMRPRRRGGSVEFTSEAELRAAVDAVRDEYPSLDAAEASPDWARLKPAVARWIMNLPHWRTSASPVHSPERAVAIATLYLKAPHLLPPLPPTSLMLDGS